MKYENIDIEIRKIQEIEIEILKEFDRVCKKYDIKYQLFAGTLLGSVRHKGFIPWDDDIDVCLLRKDYNKFIEICKTEISEDFFVQNYKTEKNSRLQFTKIRKNNTVFKMDIYENIDMHHGIFIDVFPLDGIENNTYFGKLHQKIVDVMYTISRFQFINNCRSKSYIKKRILIGLHYLLKLLPGTTYDDLVNYVIQLYNKKETEYVTHFTNGASLERRFKYMMLKDNFHNTIPGVFEEGYYPIPKNYDELLKRIFGDYLKLPQKEKQKPHHGIIEIKI